MRTRAVFNTQLTPLAFALGLGLSLPSAAQDQISVYEFNLSTQPLSHTLTQVAKTASMNLIADANLLNGLQAPALQGEISLDQALELTLKKQQFNRAYYRQQHHH
nr:STN domain-containing protein [Pseudoalteromonas phenolica]